MKYLLIVAITAVLLLGGCVEPQIKMNSIDGIPFVEHLDSNDSPCGERNYKAGCYQQINGVHHVWYSSISPVYIIQHEQDHVRGMRHTPWGKDMFNRQCSTIVAVGTSKYKAGQTICINEKGVQVS